MFTRIRYPCLTKSKFGAGFFRIMLEPTVAPQRRGKPFLRPPAENHSWAGGD